MKQKTGFIKSIIILPVIIICTNCGTTNKISEHNKIEQTACDTAKQILNFNSDSPEVKWLDKNQNDCSRIQQFLKLWGYSNDSKEYIKVFIQIKLSDDEFKLERFIELYCLLQQNPNALIDGSLPMEK